ncbi:MAG: conserved protein, permease-related protein [Candidatus Cloacimonas sp. 4484_143]|nr:MAG: conserved protein, permease-related protein [Candidatus Cloacimonas sp. 4484_143]RLC52929.1 MAG: hypothetical protein DRI23_01690 [Candidatus Cloacimonadota bacterium]RLC53405.1 MAG: hypothetical protein DRH79_03675 [Candidatus Cloacimonadota bacterium]
MQFLYLSTLILLVVSFLTNKKKTQKAIKIAYKKFTKILPAFLTMLIFISIVLFLVPQELILKVLGGSNKYLGTFFASVLGSLTLMPGFIAFPLAGILRQQGIPYMVLSAFTSTLMLVGILTFPIEKKFLGSKVTIIRNAIFFVISLIVSVVIGILFGEIGI